MTEETSSSSSPSRRLHCPASGRTVFQATSPLTEEDRRAFARMTAVRTPRLIATAAGLVVELAATTVLAITLHSPWMAVACGPLNVLMLFAVAPETQRAVAQYLETKGSPRALPSPSPLPGSPARTTRGSPSPRAR